MCGIAGYFGSIDITEDRIKSTLHLMRKRGPNSQDFQKYIIGDKQILLLHSRLKIVDLDDRANQPFSIGPVHIIFNGEIYNYLELRAELEKEGEFCSTSSDTEVLLRCYLKYGKNCVNKFDGMWSFAIYDERDQTVFLSRDAFGEKPLYIAQDPHGIYFGSEITFIKSLSLGWTELNEKQLLRYLVNGYKSLFKNRETYFRGIFEFPKMHSAVVNSNLYLQPIKYWEPRFKPVKMSSEEMRLGLLDILTRSISLRLRSDVPIAFCLSGGVDSSSLAALATKKLNININTFSLIDDDIRYNELDNIRATVSQLGCRNNLVKIDNEKSLQGLTNLIEYRRAPIGTISYYVHSLLVKEMARQGIRVSISGTGADELFTGYFDHFNLFFAEMRNHSKFKNNLKAWEDIVLPVIRSPTLQDPLLYFQDRNKRDHIFEGRKEQVALLKADFAEEFEEEFYSESLLRGRMMNELFHEIVPMILNEDDLNSMYYSIENRSPFLSKELFEFAYSIPTDLLIENGLAKHPLRCAMEGVLNDKVRLDPTKKGFNASIYSIFNFSDPEFISFLKSDGPLFDIIDKSRFDSLLGGNFQSNVKSKFLFSFINAKIFLESCRN